MKQKWGLGMEDDGERLRELIKTDCLRKKWILTSVGQLKYI